MYFLNKTYLNLVLIFFLTNVLYIANSNTNSNNSLITSQDAVERAQQMKKDLLDKLEKLAEDLPPNTLDELIDELGGPENVAEVNMTRSELYASSWSFFFLPPFGHFENPVE